MAETAIRNRILQSLISFRKLYDHHADAMIVLFKIAGATFEAYEDPSVVDRCFELLKNNCSRDSIKGKLVQVSVACSVKGGCRTNEAFKEVLELRKRGWEGLTPPPVFTSPGSPVTLSPSISSATLSDFTIANTPDDDAPDDHTAVTPHDRFHLEDGNVEVLCENTLFRIHTSVLSFHSPALRQMFSQKSLACAESPNGCPRILSSDTAGDFATLLKMIYLPRYVAPHLWWGIVPLTFCINRFPERNKTLDFTTFSSLLRISTKYEMPAVRSHLLDVVRDAYPERFEGVTPTRSLGETAFNGPTPHPNEVLKL